MERLHEQLRGAAPNKRELHTALTSIKSKVATIKGEIKKEVAPLQADIQAATDKLTQEMDEINAKLRGMKPVLREHEKLGTFVEGYMVGICICKCPQQPRMLATCSGEPTPGFREAVAATPFELAEGFQMSERQREEIEQENRKKWECAAPKLLQAGGVEGHKVRTCRKDTSRRC